MEDDGKNRRARRDAAVKGGVALVLVVALLGAGELFAPSFVREGVADAVSSLMRGGEGGRAVVSRPLDVPAEEPSAAPAEPPAASAPEEAPLAPVPEDRMAQSGSSYHTTGVVVALDPEGFAFLLEVEESTEDIARGAHVVADCANAETSPLLFSELAVGTRVGIRSVQAHAADGTIPVQRFAAVIGEDGAAQTEDVPEASIAKPALSAEVEQVFAESGCGFRVVGTVVSLVNPEDGSFDLRVEGGAPVAAGETISVAMDELRQTVGDMGALVEGASGVTVGFSYFPTDGVVHARALAVGEG